MTRGHRVGLGGVPRGETCALMPISGGAAPGMPFGACVRSKLFAWHVAWLSAMQLRHYLFIGTLNPLLEHLARRDPDVGKGRTAGRGPVEPQPGYGPAPR